MNNLREEFEQWWNNKMAMCFYSQPKSQKETIYHASWLAWQASRAGIVVDVPEACAFNLCDLVSRDDVIESIRSIGLSIKGE